MSLKDLVTSYSALHEFGMLAKTILPIMTDPKVPRDEKRQTLNNLVNELTEKTFANGIVAGQIMEIINMKEDVCRDYVDADAQVGRILGWLPRMSMHRDRLKKEVVKHRKHYGLKI